MKAEPGGNFSMMQQFECVLLAEHEHNRALYDALDDYEGATSHLLKIMEEKVLEDIALKDEKELLRLELDSYMTHLLVTKHDIAT